jgi:hypothetical protein
MGTWNSFFKHFHFRLGATFMLVSYLVIFLLPPGLIPHSIHDHDEHAEGTHTEDPCHIAIFHPGAEGACHHKFHLTAACEDCHEIQVTLARQYIIPLISLSEETQKQVGEFILHPEEIIYRELPQHNERGPPATFPG